MVTRALPDLLVYWLHVRLHTVAVENPSFDSTRPLLDKLLSKRVIDCFQLSLYWAYCICLTQKVHVQSQVFISRLLLVPGKVASSPRVLLIRLTVLNAVKPGSKCCM